MKSMRKEESSKPPKTPSNPMPANPDLSLPTKIPTSQRKSSNKFNSSLSAATADRISKESRFEALPKQPARFASRCARR